MKQRPRLNRSARLVFTRDFHELRRGRLEQRADCTIAYDPGRIIPEAEPYHFGDPERPIVAHLRFRAGGPVADLVLRSRVGMHHHVPLTSKGEGALLTGTSQIPDDAQWIEVWFTYLCTDRTTRYDSDYGRNYTFRFLHDVRLLEAEIVDSPSVPTATLNCRAATTAEVEAVTFRYHITNQPRVKEVERAMQSVGTHAEGSRVWELNGDPVPTGAVLAFDFIYYVAGIRYKDDNEGQYYIAAPTHLTGTAGL